MRLKIVIPLLMMISFALSCSEEFPAIPEDPEGLINANLRMQFPGLLLPEGDTRNVVFIMDVTNIFDEVLFSQYYFKGYVEFWLPSETSIRRRVEFHYETSDQVVLVPHSPFPVWVKWDQRFDDGTLLSDHAGTIPERVYLKAKGYVQVFKHLGVVPMQEIDCYISYY